MHRMAISCLLLWVSACGARAGNDHAEAEEAAHRAGVAWLAQVDEGKLDASWEAAAAPFKSAVGKEEWAKTVKRVREPLGAVESRELESARYATALPGAPNGEYVVLRFRTSFAAKRSAVETVTPMREGDGTWRVSGYYVK